MNNYSYRQSRYKSLWFYLNISIAVCFFLLALPTTYAQEADVNLQLLLQQRVQAMSNNQVIADRTVQYGKEVKSFYSKRAYQPAWSEGRQVARHALSFIACKQLIEEHGLTPSDYHFKLIEQIINYQQKGNVLSPDDIIALEILTTDAYLTLAHHFYSGKTNAKELGLEWHHKTRKLKEADKYLIEALKDKHIRYSLELLLPLHEGYQQLVDALRIYRNAKWEPIEIPPKILLQRGAKAPIVTKVRQRLKATGDLRPGAPIKEEFDRELESAIARFQKRNGLLVDGYIRPRMLDVLNKPVEERIQQIQANLDRWRWMPEDMGTDYLMINIPGFEVTMMVGGAVDYRERVIVGLEKWQTPAFADTMKYIVINPYWNLPKSIAKTELIPKILADKDFIVNNDITVFQGGETIDPSTLDFTTIDSDKYRFRHGVNAFNPLGAIKFMFPNSFDVYVHDTPTKHLFDYTFRSHSHGCIRINEPFKFADYLLYDVKEWNLSKIEAQVESQEQKTVHLKTPVPIYIYYWTVYVDETGAINFRDDIYDWDKKMADVW